MFAHLNFNQLQRILGRVAELMESALGNESGFSSGDGPFFCSIKNFRFSLDHDPMFTSMLVFLFTQPGTGINFQHSDLHRLFSTDDGDASPGSQNPGMKPIFVTVFLFQGFNQFFNILGFFQVTDEECVFGFNNQQVFHPDTGDQLFGAEDQ